MFDTKRLSQDKYSISCEGEEYIVEISNPFSPIPNIKNLSTNKKHPIFRIFPRIIQQFIIKEWKDEIHYDKFGAMVIVKKLYRYCDDRNFVIVYKLGGNGFSVAWYRRSEIDQHWILADEIIRGVSRFPTALEKARDIINLNHQRSDLNGTENQQYSI